MPINSKLSDNSALDQINNSDLNIADNSALNQINKRDDDNVILVKDVDINNVTIPNSNMDFDEVERNISLIKLNSCEIEDDDNLTNELQDDAAN